MKMITAQLLAVIFLNTLPPGPLIESDASYWTQDLLLCPTDCFVSSDIYATRRNVGINKSNKMCGEERHSCGKHRQTRSAYNQILSTQDVKYAGLKGVLCSRTNFSSITKSHKAATETNRSTIVPAAQFIKTYSVAHS